MTYWSSGVFDLTRKNPTPRSHVIALASAVLSPVSRASMRKNRPLTVNISQPINAKRFSFTRAVCQR